MPRVMMRCAWNWKVEIYTGLDRPRPRGLGGLGEHVIGCPNCRRPHFLRRLYFEGDDPGEQGNEALEVAPGFAAQIGVLIGGMALIEGYLSRLLAKAVGINDKDAETIMGTFPAYSQRINLLENLRDRSEDPLFRDDLGKIVKHLRKAGGLRDKYAHAQYSIAHDVMHVVPFFGDVRKKPRTEELTVDDVSRDVEQIKSIKSIIHGYLYRGERP